MHSTLAPSSWDFSRFSGLPGTQSLLVMVLVCQYHRFDFLMPLSNTPFVSLRPLIYLDGDQRQDMEAECEALVIEHRLSAPARCILRLRNRIVEETGEFRFSVPADVDFGRLLRIAIPGSDEASTADAFSGLVNFVEVEIKADRGARFVFQAEDRLQLLSRTTRSRVFEDVTDADLIGQVADDYGMLAELSIDGGYHSGYSQLSETDYALLCNRVRAVGAYFVFRDDVLMVRSWSQNEDPDIELRMGDNLTEFRGTADLRGQHGMVGVAGWDYREKERIQDGASGPEVQNPGGVWATGANESDHAFGDSARIVTAPGLEDADQGEMLARAYRIEEEKGFVTVHGIATESGRLNVGDAVEIAGVGKPFSGNYRLTALRHRFDTAMGLRTEFEAARLTPKEKRRTRTRTKEKPDADRKRSRSKQRE